MGGIKNFDSNLTRKNLLGDTADNIRQVKGAVSDMYKEYRLMKSHKYKYLDDYYHCKANYNAAKRGKIGKMTAEFLGNEKEAVDYLKNRFYKGLSYQDSIKDYWHDINVNRDGIRRSKRNFNMSAQNACSDLREKNKELPKEYW